jgi:hypothetical protein
VNQFGPGGIYNADREGCLGTPAAVGVHAIR